jgi:hypothetical protein
MWGADYWGMIRLLSVLFFSILLLFVLQLHMLAIHAEYIAQKGKQFNTHLSSIA